MSGNDQSMNAQVTYNLIFRVTLHPRHHGGPFRHRGQGTCSALPPQIPAFGCRSPLLVGGGPMVVVSTAAFHARVRDSFPGLGGLKEQKCIFPSTRKTQYCGEPPWPRGSVLGHRPPGFLILNSVSGGQRHLTHLTLLRRFSWPNLACMCTKVAWSSIHFIFSSLGFQNSQKNEMLS